MDFHNFLHRISQEREYEAQRFCFILGAGASYDCGIAKANDLVDQWYNELLDRCCQHGQWKEILRLPREEALKETINAIKSDGSLLEEIFSPTKWETTRSFTTADLIRIKFMEDESEKYSKLFAYTFPTATMRRTFIKNFTKEGSPQKGHEALSRLLCETDNNIVITTNFDRIVEMAIQNSGYSRDLILLKDCEDQSCAAFDKNNCLSLTFQNQKNNAPLVIKAHGDVDRIRQKNTIEELRQLPDSFYQKLKSIFQIYKPIFIGYSGND